MAYGDEPLYARPAPRPSPWSIAGPLLALLIVVAALAYFVGGWGHGPANDPNSPPRPVEARGDLAEDEKSTIALFKAASPSVVYITTTGLGLDRFTLNLHEVPQGTGSGFIWDDQGRIVTNYHVLLNAKFAKVTLSDGTSHDARAVGGARDYDLAVLKIDVPAARLHPIPIGTSGDLQVGQKAFAIGDPFGLDYTLTTGIISALGRVIKREGQPAISGVIQTDAAINPGNSGGPLLDSAGRLIGVNTAIVSPTGSYSGIGFAIPVDTVNQVVPQLIAGGTPSVLRPAIGATFGLARKGNEAPVTIVLEVNPGSGAAEAGLRPMRNGVGDIVLSIDGLAVRNSADIAKVLGNKKPGDIVTVKVIRDGETVDIPVKLDGI